MTHGEINASQYRAKKESNNSAQFKDWIKLIALSGHQRYALAYSMDKSVLFLEGYRSLPG